MKLVWTSWWFGVVVVLIAYDVKNIAAQSALNTSAFFNSSINGNEGRFSCIRSNVTFDLDDVCDGDYKCPYLDDEYLCDNDYCDQAELLCAFSDNNNCVYSLDYVCDGDDDCQEDGFDELFCDPVECGISCSCSSYRVSCEGPNLVDDRNISKSIRDLKFLGQSLNGTKLPPSLPFNLTTYPLLVQIHISSTGLIEVHREDFANLNEMRTMKLPNNDITRIDDFSFSGMSKLVNLILSKNAIAALSSRTFNGLVSLEDLDLSFNQISVIPEGTFSSCLLLKNLFLHRSGLVSLLSGAFTGLRSIQYMHMFGNHISSIGIDAFKGVHTVQFIDLTNNSISELRKGMFDDQTTLTWISFSDNPLEYIEPGTFRNLNSIEYINLVNVELENLQPDTFNGVSSLQGLSTDDFRLCCLFDEADVCTIASMNFLDSCSRLMPNLILRIALWVIGWGALIGNTIVLVLRFRTGNSPSANTQGLFITNLAIADFLMGIYMIIISSADIYYGEYFYLYASQWRESTTCKAAGFIAVLSSETSVFILAIITIDRVLSVVFPFGKLKFRKTSARVGVVIIWIVAMAVSIVPLVVGAYIDGFYGLSDVCVGLPLNVESRESGELVFNHETRVWEYIQYETKQRPSWVYSIVLFLGVNFLIFILILICYIVIFVSVRKSARSVANPTQSGSDHAREVKLATRMAIIVLTDFFCWMPVIIMGILSQSGAVSLPTSLYAWSVVFILPINASINPYIYTFIASCGRSKAKSKHSIDSKTQKSTIRTVVVETRT